MCRINLLPEESRPQMRGGFQVRRGVLLGLLVLGVVLVAVVGTASWQARTLGKLESQAAELKVETERYKPQIMLVKGLRSRKADLETRLGAIRALDRGRDLRIAAMDDLSTALPEFVWLTSFLEGDKVVTVEGVAFTSLAVFEFMVGLEAMPRFAEVSLDRMRRADLEDDEVTRFTLTTTLAGR